MKLNKTFGRIATTLVATAMLASVTAVPAMAADDQIQTGNEGAALASIVIDKELDKPANAYAPDVDFTFTISKGDADEEEDALLDETASGTATGGSTVTLEVYNGVMAAFATTTGTASFAPSTGTGDDSDIGKTLLTEQATFAITNTAFQHAGVYKYTLSESTITAEGNYEGITNDTNVRYLYVYVRANNNGGYEAYGAVVKGGNGDEAGTTGKQDRFTNTYLGGSTDPDTNEVMVNKQVTGDLGNKSNPFNFTIAINGASGEKYYVEYWHYVDTDDDDIEDTWVVDNRDAFDVSSGAAATPITLAHNEAIKIYGLSDSDTYTIVETDYNDDNYTTTVTNTVSGEDTVNEGTVTGSITPTSETQKNITYTNKRDAVSPTGIAMDIAPYALLVIVAAAGCFVFLRKRRED